MGQLFAKWQVETVVYVDLKFGTFIGQSTRRVDPSGQLFLTIVPGSSRDLGKLYFNDFQTSIRPPNPSEWSRTPTSKVFVHLQDPVSCQRPCSINQEGAFNSFPLT